MLRKVHTTHFSSNIQEESTPDSVKSKHLQRLKETMNLRLLPKQKRLRKRKNELHPLRREKKRTQKMLKWIRKLMNKTKSSMKITLN